MGSRMFTFNIIVLILLLISYSFLGYQPLSGPGLWYTGFAKLKSLSRRALNAFVGGASTAEFGKLFQELVI